MIVNDFKASTLTIGWKAQEMSEMLLVRITGKRVYRDLEFEEAQREHRMTVQQKLVNLHQDVVNIMTNSYEVFKNDGPEVGIPCPALKQGPHIPSDHAASLLHFTNVRILDIHLGPTCSSPSVSSLLWQHSGSCLCFFKDLFLCFWVFLPVCMYTTWVPAALGGQRGRQVVSCSVGVGNGT